MEKQREVCAVRPLSVSEENSCRVQEEIGLFFPLLAFFAYDGQRSDFGLSCNVGCSL